MENWHPNQEPSLPRGVQQPRQQTRTPRFKLFKLGGVLMVSTAIALTLYVTLQSASLLTATPDIVETADNNQIAQRTPEPLVVEMAKKPAKAIEDVEPAAGNPGFLPEPLATAEPRWQMDIGQWDPASRDTSRAIEHSALEQGWVDQGAIEPHQHHQSGVYVWEEYLPPTISPENMLEPSESPEPSSNALAAITPGIPPAAPESQAVPEAEFAVAKAAPKRQLRPSSGPPMIAILIDDLGNNAQAVNRLKAMSPPPSMSFLPYPEATPKLAKIAAEAGAEIFVHLPMEPEGPQNPGPGALTTDLDSNAITRRVISSLMRVPGAVGINNHMGSKFTSYERGMEQVIKEVSRRGLIFVDSRTSSRSVAAKVAKRRGADFAIRNVFLDHEPTPDFIRRQLNTLEAIARKTGSALAIGHPYKHTIKELEAWLPQARARGIELVPVSTLVAWRQCVSAKSRDACADGGVFVADAASRIGVQ